MWIIRKTSLIFKFPIDHFQLSHVSCHTLRKFTLKAHNPTDAKNVALSHCRHLPFRQANLNTAVYRTLYLCENVCAIFVLSILQFLSLKKAKKDQHILYIMNTLKMFFSILNASVKEV